MKLLLTDRFIRSLFLVGMGIYFLLEHRIRERPESMQDLIDINGTITNYSFKDNTGLRGNGYQYYIFLDQYTNKFQISAEYLRFFNKNQFENNFKVGNRINLSIPNYQKDLIGLENNLLLTSLSMNGVRYLTKHKIIKHELSLAESNSDFILGGVFIVGGILLYLFYDKLKKATNIT